MQAETQAVECKDKLSFFDKGNWGLRRGAEMKRLVIFLISLICIMVFSACDCSGAGGCSGLNWNLESDVETEDGSGNEDGMGNEGDSGNEDGTGNENGSDDEDDENDWSNIH